MMNLLRTTIPDVIIIEPDLHTDDRGYFMETWRQNALNEFIGRDIRFIQDNESLSHAGTLRGLHFQLPPFAQSKLVRTVCGKVITVAVDLRQGSPTFRQYVMEELSGSNKRQLFIPRGFAHGFISLENNTILTYKVDNYYSPTHERGIVWNDQELDIAWPMPAETIYLSTKDKALPPLSGADLFPMQDLYAC